MELQPLVNGNWGYFTPKEVEYTESQRCNDGSVCSLPSVPKYIRKKEGPSQCGNSRNFLYKIDTPRKINIEPENDGLVQMMFRNSRGPVFSGSSR